MEIVNMIIKLSTAWCCTQGQYACGKQSIFHNSHQLITYSFAHFSTAMIIRPDAGGGDGNMIGAPVVMFLEARMCEWQLAGCVSSNSNEHNCCLRY